MNIELNNQTDNEVEYVEETNKTHTKFNRVQVLIMLACFAFAFVMWCYANFIDDPIIQKEIPIHIDYLGEEIIICKPSKVVVYGEKSELADVNEFKITLKRSDFANDKKISITIDLPEDVYSHDNEIQVELIGSNND